MGGNLHLWFIVRKGKIVAERLENYGAPTKAIATPSKTVGLVTVQCRTVQVSKGRLSGWHTYFQCRARLYENLITG